MSTAYQVTGAKISQAVATSRQCGPFYLGTTLFVVAFSETCFDEFDAHNIITVYKSVDAGATWAAIGGTDIECWRGDVDANAMSAFSTWLDNGWPASPYIHILYWTPNASAIAATTLSLSRFNMSSEAYDQLGVSGFTVQPISSGGSGITMDGFHVAQPDLGDYLETIFYSDHTDGGSGFTERAIISRARVESDYTWGSKSDITTLQTDGTVQNHACGASALGIQAVIAFATEETLSGPDTHTRVHLVSTAVGAESSGDFSNVTFGGGLSSSNAAQVKTVRRFITGTGFSETMAISANDAGWQTGGFFLDGSAIGFYALDNPDAPLFDEFASELSVTFCAATTDAYYFLWWDFNAEITPERTRVYAQTKLTPWASGGAFEDAGNLFDESTQACGMAWCAAPVPDRLGVLFCGGNSIVEPVWYLGIPLTPAGPCAPRPTIGGFHVITCGPAPLQCLPGRAF